MKTLFILGAILVVILGVHSQAFAVATDHQFMVDSFFDVFRDGAITRISSNGTSVVRVSDPVPGTQFFDTEMLSMDLTSIGDPDFDLLRITAGSAFGMSPSTGQIGDPDFDLLNVSSFFDVFTELSLDGGQTWLHNTQAAHFSGVADSFFDITYRLDQDVMLIGDGHVTVLKSASTLHMTPAVPEPGSVAALLTGFAGLAGFGIRRRKTNLGSS